MMQMTTLPYDPGDEWRIQENFFLRLIHEKHKHTRVMFFFCFVLGRSRFVGSDKQKVDRSVDTSFHFISLHKHIYLVHGNLPEQYQQYQLV